MMLRDGEQVIIGRREGSRLVDCHTYEVPSAYHAVRAFVQEMAAAGFEPCGRDMVTLQVGSALEPIEDKMLAMALHAVRGKR